MRSFSSDAGSEPSTSDELGQGRRVHLVPIEFTKACETCVEHTVERHYRPGDLVVLLNVLYDSEATCRQAGRRHARKAQAEHCILDRFALQLAAQGVEFRLQVNFIVLDIYKGYKPYLADEIARVAEEVGAHAVYLGSSKRNPVQKLLYAPGTSIAEMLAHVCECKIVLRPSLSGSAKKLQWEGPQDAAEPTRRRSLRRLLGHAPATAPTGVPVHKGPFVTKHIGYQDVCIVVA